MEKKSPVTRDTSSNYSNLHAKFTIVFLLLQLVLFVVIVYFKAHPTVYNAYKEMINILDSHSSLFLLGPFAIWVWYQEIRSGRQEKKEIIVLNTRLSCNVDNYRLTVMNMGYVNIRLLSFYLTTKDKLPFIRKNKMPIGTSIPGFTPCTLESMEVVEFDLNQWIEKMQPDTELFAALDYHNAENIISKQKVLVALSMRGKLFEFHLEEDGIDTLMLGDMYKRHLASKGWTKEGLLNYFHK